MGMMSGGVRRVLVVVPGVLTCAQRDDGDRGLRTDQLVPDGLQDSQDPAHRSVPPTHQHPEVGDLPERVESGGEGKKQPKYENKY